MHWFLLTYRIPYVHSIVRALVMLVGLLVLLVLGAMPAHAATLSGTLYVDRGATAFTDGGAEIHLRVDGAGSYATTTLAGSGAFVIDAVSGIATGTILTLWVNNDPTLRAVTVTKAATSSAGIVNVDLYQNHIIIRGESPTATTTNAELGIYDGNDNGAIQFSVSGTSLTTRAGNVLYVWESTHYAPGGNVTLAGNAAGFPDGDLAFATTSTLTASGTVAIAGSLSVAGDVTFENTTLTFIATTTGKTLRGTLTGSSSLPNLSFDGVGGGWTFSDNASTSDLVIENGSVVAPALLTISGDYSNAGAFVAGAGVVYFDGADTTLSGTMVGASAFNAIVFDSNGTTTILHNASTTDFTITGNPEGVTWDTFAKLDNPETLPANSGRAAAFSPDGVYLAIGHSSSPFVTIYKRSGDTFTKLTNPTTLPASTAWGVAFSPDGVYLAVGHSLDPYITIYKRDGDTFTKLTNPEILPTGTGRGLSFSSDGVYSQIPL